MANQGAPANFISFRQFEETITDVSSKRTQLTHIYRGVTGGPCFTSKMSVDIDEFLQIRHVSSLILISASWMITKCSYHADFERMGGRVLEM